MFDNYPDVLTAEQTAEALQCNIKTLYGLLKRNEIPNRKVGNQYRIPKTPLIEYACGK